ncbi:MAG: transposase [Firmicutes bacterium]|nr:transposase [Bacillota bacterium]
MVVQDAPGHILWAGQMAHTREAWEGRLLAWAHQQRSAVHGVMETSQRLVVDWLRTTGIWVYPVNSKESDARRKPSGAKTDRMDAAILARLGWTERDALRPLRPTDEAWGEWRQLTRIDESLTQQATRLAWLRQPRDPRPAQEAPRIWGGLPQRALEASPGKRRAPVWAVRALVARWHAVRAEQQTLRGPLAELFLASLDADLGMSVLEVAVTWGARLQAGFGPQRDRREWAEAVQALAGASPVLDQSGKLQRVHMRRACDKHIRAAVHQLAFTSLSRCAWVREYYDQYRAWGHGHHAALHALPHVWLDSLPHGEDPPALRRGPVVGRPCAARGLTRSAV